jgi:hypothetical protein
MMPPRRLGLLAFYRRPEPGAATYTEEVQYLSRQTGCDAAHFDALLRDGAVVTEGKRANTFYLSNNQPAPATRDRLGALHGASHGR